jgi:hypothetical protein
MMFLLTRVYCSDEYAPSPSAFILEFGEKLLNDFAEKSKAIEELQEQFENVLSVRFTGEGSWIENEELGELLDSEEILIVDKLPIDKCDDMDDIRCHATIICAGGDLVFSAYHKCGGCESESITVSINRLCEALQKEVKMTDV